MAQPWDIPVNWRWAQLGDVCLPVNKVQPVENPNQAFTYLDIASIDNALHRVVAPKSYLGRYAPSRARQVVHGGNTLFSTARTYLKNVAMVPPEFDGQIASTGFCVLNPSDAIDPKFVFYYVISDDFVSNLNPLRRGTRYPAVRDNDALSQYLAIPPLAEQRRILAEIDKPFARLDASVAALRRAQANLKCYRSSVLKEACHGTLVPTEAELARSEGREYEPVAALLERILEERPARWDSDPKPLGKYKEPVLPDTSGLPEPTEGWVWATLDQTATTVKNGYSKRPDGLGDTPILRISAVRPMSVDMDDVRWVSNSHALQDFLISQGDLLFTRYNGNPSFVGVCGVVPRIEQNTLHPDKLIRVQLVLRSTLPHFIQLAGNIGASQDYLAARVRTTAGQSGISGSDLKQMPIPLPPLVEQRRIVAEVERRLAVIQQAEASVETSLKRADQMRQSILKKAFAGELVPQDPNDEPVSVAVGTHPCRAGGGRDCQGRTETAQAPACGEWERDCHLVSHRLTPRNDNPN